MRNLIRIGVGERHGAQMWFGDRRCRIYKSQKHILTVYTRDGLSQLPYHRERYEESNIVQPKETAHLWDRRYGHLGYANLANLIEKDLVKSIKVETRDFMKEVENACMPCIKSKQTRASFPTSRPKLSLR
jgi:hypothetical protein